MPSDSGFQGKPRLSLGVWLTVLFSGWLALISVLHFYLNIEKKSALLVRMGYMPVISNLACPLLDSASRGGEGIRFEALKFSSFSELGEALRNGDIEAAFMIAPLGIVLHQQGVDVRVVYIGNRHESTLVIRKDLDLRNFAGLAAKSIAVPIRYSGHNLAVRRLAEEFRVPPGDIKIVEMNPPDMPSALATGSLDAYFVGEPFAAQAVRSGRAKVLYYVEQVWPGFICNILLVHQDFIRKHPERVRLLVQGAARSGVWARRNPGEAARIASRYWGQPSDLIAFALDNPKGRIVYDRYVPRENEMQDLADQMKRYKLIDQSRIGGLVQNKFALAANLKNISDLKSILGERN